MARTATARKSNPPPPQARLVGKVVIAKLDAVTKNDWNPNEMTLFERQSLRHGLLKDGWLVSHALTIWRTDEKGKTKNIIIDGEHRWEEAKALGMVEGPMVFLDGVTLADAKQLTVKLDAKRGRFNEEKLGVLVRSVQEVLHLETQALDLGIDAKLLTEYLKPQDTLPPLPADLPSGQKAAVKNVPLFFKPEQHEQFLRLIHDLAGHYKTQNATDTIFEAVRRAHAAATSK
jgi:hypothetical protein